MPVKVSGLKERILSLSAMNIPITIVVVFIGLIVAYPLFYYLIYEPLRILIRWINHLYFIRLEREKVAYLEKNFSFYRALLPELKLRFEKRVASFLYNKKFVGVNVEMTDEMKLFIAACAIQLTFGLRNFWLTEFDEIRVHADSYQLASFDHRALGHVSDKGIISLSWSDLQEGFQNPTDGINVGLHEMAHALYLSSVEKGWNMRFAVEYDNWEKEAIIEWKKGKQSGEHMLRAYAFINLFEFFAVCVEYFFEKPAELKAAAPRLYIEMERLLRLDPMNPADPVLDHLPVIFPSQPIPLPRYNPFDLLKKIVACPKNFGCFLAGTICWLGGIFILFKMIQFDLWLPNAKSPYEGNAATAGFIFFFAAFFYIQVFYDDKKKN